MPGSAAVRVSVVSDIVPWETSSNQTSVPEGTPVTFTTASRAGVIVLKVGSNIVFSNNNGSVIIYRNGHTHTTFSLDGGADSAFNSGDMYIGRSISNDSTLSGYIAEVMMVSHSTSAGVLTSTSFGEFKKNIWVPKDISGLSNQDFYLKFSDANNLGTDSSGNSRNWTVNGCGVDHKSLNTPTSDG